MLTTAQLQQFAREGYLCLEGVVPREQCAHLVDMTWAQLPQGWNRSMPSTWCGDVEDSCHTASLAHRRGHLKFQKGPLLTDPEAIATFGPQSKLAGICAELIGQPVVTRYRGLYVIAPLDEDIKLRKFDPPHVEAHPVQIVATTYLEDVEPGCGGLLVWPGSHLDLYHAFASKLEFMQNEKYQELLERYSRLEPIELSGKAGDVILIHHRLFHAPSLNYGSRLRFAMFSDYQVPHFQSMATETPGGRIWEDWEPMRGVHDGLEPSTHVYRDQRAEDRKGERPQYSSVTMTNKKDASRLIRTIRRGEVWLMLSDSAKLSGTNRVEPCGEAFDICFMTLTRDGEPLQSATEFDFVARVIDDDADAAPTVLTLPDIPREVHVRIVKVNLPISASEILFEGLLDRVHSGCELVVSRNAALVRRADKATDNRSSGSNVVAVGKKLAGLLRAFRKSA